MARSRRLRPALGWLLVAVMLAASACGAAGEETETTLAEGTSTTEPGLQLSPGGVAAFNPPTQMSVDRTERVEVRVSGSPISDEDLTENMAGDGAAIVESLETSPVMRVELSGDPDVFVIDDLTDPAQALVPERTTSWLFDVTPTQAGDHVLRLNVAAFVSSPDGARDSVAVIPVLERSVAVTAVSSSGPSPLLIGAMVLLAAVALGVWVLAARRRKRTAAVLTPDAATGSSVFVSYRRDDSAGWAGRIADRLLAQYGPERVFIDVTTIGPGQDFEQAIQAQLTAMAAVVVVIGPRWLVAADSTGRPRLDDPADFVRREVGAGLGGHALVVPVLVDGAVMPSAADLPTELADLARRNAVVVSPQSFDADADRLVAAIDAHLASQVAAS